MSFGCVLVLPVPPKPVAMFAASMKRTRATWVETLHVVADLSVSTHGPYTCARRKSANGANYALRHRADAEAHLQRIRIRPIGGGLILVIQRTALNQRYRHLPFRVRAVRRSRRGFPVARS